MIVTYYMHSYLPACICTLLQTVGVGETGEASASPLFNLKLRVQESCSEVVFGSELGCKKLQSLIYYKLFIKLNIQLYREGDTCPHPPPFTIGSLHY